MYKQIIVGIDGSPHGDKALEQAVRMAEESKADLHVYHAIKHQAPIPSYPLGLDPLHQQPILNTITQRAMQEYREQEGAYVIQKAKQKVAAMGVDLEGKLDYHLETALGPAEYAEKFAREHKVDVIVLGCAGHHSRARKLFLGTVAGKVVNEAPCNVLLVR